MNIWLRLLGPGNERMHAAVIAATTLTLCACALVLVGTIAAGKTVPAEFATAVGAVSGLAGWAYGRGKKAEASASTPPEVVSGNGSTGGKP